MTLQYIAPEDRSRNLAYYHRNKARLLRSSSGRRAVEGMQRFGVSAVWYLAQYQHQAGKCACCGQPETALNNDGSGTKRLSIDHDHVTGQVRELLCQRCNFMVANDSQRQRAGADYLDRHAAKVLDEKGSAL